MNTNLQARLEQNKKDIEKLQEERVRLEKEVKKPRTPKPLVVHTLKAEVTENDCWPIRIVVDEQTSKQPVFYVSEIEEIIAGLQRLIDFVENK